MTEAITLPPGTTPEEAEILLEAERKRRAKAAANPATPPPLDSVEAHCARVQAKITASPIVTIGQEIDRRMEQAQKLLESAGIPQRHRRRISPTCSPWNTAADKLAERLGSGFIIALTGVQGTGKTQLGSAIIYAATDKLMSARYAAAMEFFIALKDTFDTVKKSESEIIAAFVRPKLLVLDEMDERSESAWENRLLFHMLNQRYNQMTDTLLISRRSESDFLASLGESIQSRIQETGGNIHCEWPSYREGKQ